MKEKIQIRPAREGDAESLLMMIVEHAQFEGEQFDPQGKLDKLRVSLATGKNFNCLVVESDEKVEGYCTYMVHYDSWHQAPYIFVDGLWLNAPFRGASIGSQIFALLEQEARQLNCATIQVLTPSTNSSGISFYQKLGARQSSKAYFTLTVAK